MKTPARAAVTLRELQAATRAGGARADLARLICEAIRLLRRSATK